MKADRIRPSEIRAFTGLLQQKAGQVLEPGTYPARYLAHILDHAAYYSAVYAQLLNLLLSASARSRQTLSLLDYGAGNGLLGLMALHLGFGKVYINDQDAGFLEAARRMAAALGLQPQAFIEGGAPAVLKACREAPPDLLAGSDVIEHIYDLEGFFRDLQQLNPRMILCLSTACNPLNPLLRRRFRHIQLRDEFEGGNPDTDPLFAARSIEPFVVQRRNIITGAAPHLPGHAVSQLVTATRGLQKQDILVAVERYVREGICPQPPAHPTNTCDPETGSWSERMLDLDTYRQLMRAAGFDCTVQDGFYNQVDPGRGAWLRWMANRLIPLSGHRLAPYIVLVGRPFAAGA